MNFKVSGALGTVSTVPDGEVGPFLLLMSENSLLYSQMLEVLLMDCLKKKKKKEGPGSA